MPAHSHFSLGIVISAFYKHSLFSWASYSIRFIENQVRCMNRKGGTLYVPDDTEIQAARKEGYRSGWNERK